MERWMEKNKENGKKENDPSADLITPGYSPENKSKHSYLDQGRLDDAGFTKLEEREAWAREGKVVQGGKYYYNRNRWDIHPSTKRHLSFPTKGLLWLPSQWVKNISLVENLRYLKEALQTARN